VIYERKRNSVWKTSNLMRKLRTGKLHQIN